MQQQSQHPEEIKYVRYIFFVKLFVVCVFHSKVEIMIRKFKKWW